MRLRSAAVLLLLVLHWQQCNANDKRNQTPEVSPRRHDSSERSSGRRWTTSRNSPYQKIVSSYEQEVPAVAETSSEPEEGDRAKAKSHKRKQWRTGAAVHDQIPSESQKAEAESNDSSSDSQREQGSRRRSNTVYPKDPDTPTEATVSNNKKRRRPSITAATTTTIAPQTMSDTLYQYFRPLEQDVPQDDIIPFLDFGRKLSPTIPTPSGANSIENKSTITKHRARTPLEDSERNSSDEEILQEDMDVTVVKKAIERNSVPRTKLRMREQGISDYYRKRNPAQIRTTENLIGTSDSSTVSSVIGTKVGVLKKVNRQHNYNSKIQDQIYEDTKPQKISLEMQELQPPKIAEIMPVEKKRQLIIRHPHRPSAIKQEYSQTPLTAESTLVKTVIKDISLVDESRQLESKDETVNEPNQTPLSNNSNVTIPSINSDASVDSQINNTSGNQHENENVTSKGIKLPKVLSTTVVTSVSVQDIPDLHHETTTESSIENTTTKRSAISISNDTSMALPLGVATHKNTTVSVNSTTSNPVTKNSSSSITHNLSKPTLNNTSREVKFVPVKNDTPLRSRDIYKPKIFTSGISIPHLPRQLPTLTSNSTRKTPVETTSFSSVSETASSTSSSPPSSSTQPKQFTPKAYSTTPKSINTTEEVLKQNSSFHELVLSPGSTPDPLYNTPNLTKSTEKVDSSVNLTKVQIIDKPKQEKVNPQTDTKAEEAAHNSAAEELLTQDLETESVPPPKYDETVENLTFVPVESYSPEDQFPIYFTSLPTAPVPVVDTRPETEVAVVKEQKNSSTSRSGTEWMVGAVNKDVEVVYPEPLGVGAYVLAILGVVPIVIGALIGARFILNHNRKKVLDESEYSSEYNRSPLTVSPATPPPLPTKLPRIPTHTHTHTHGNWNETEKAAPTLSPLPPPGTSPSARWEFPRDKLRLQTLLGQGNFGQVWKAEADDITGHEGLTRLVAVKTVKESATAREREDLLRELGIMQELGSHPNVVTLLGCCTEKEPIYLLMEYVMYGKLLSFLRDHRTRAHYYNFSDAGDALTSRDLTVFGYCVARGMDYLTNKSIIHRDLAARNVLVDHNKLCKIADFGMSRNVRDTGQIYEQRQSKGALPIRWMAPESLHFSLFTHKTDVWSFGILMWEIVTLGSTPYCTMGAREVMRRVRDGYRLDRPSHCRPELFRVIAQCWHSEPSKRPTFAELKVELGQLLSDAEHKGSFVDLDSFADEMRRDSLHRPH